MSFDEELFMRFGMTPLPMIVAAVELKTKSTYIVGVCVCSLRVMLECARICVDLCIGVRVC